MRCVLRLLVVAVLPLTVAACTSVAGPSPSSASGRQTPESVSSSPSSSASPLPKAMPSTSPTAEARRPDGLLIVDGGEPLEGEMGSGCWRFGSGTGCASAGMPVPDPGPQAAPGAACTVAFSDGTPILYGRVSAFPADAADPQAALTVLAVRGDGPVDVPFSFTCPGAGDWVLFASLHAAPGDQTYFWRLLVR